MYSLRLKSIFDNKNIILDYKETDEEIKISELEVPYKPHKDNKFFADNIIHSNNSVFR